MTAVPDTTDGPNPELLARAAAEVLACPRCAGILTVVPGGLRCAACGEQYPVVDGILQLRRDSSMQAVEIKERDRLARTNRDEDPAVLLHVVSGHHSIPAMRSYHAMFLDTFSDSDWVVDLGTGWGWYWTSHHRGPLVLAMDMSHDSLILARRLVPPSRVLLVCADATTLPLRPQSVAGIWTVQMLEHVPPAIFDRAVSELWRVLRTGAFVEYHGRNLGPLNALVRLAGVIVRPGARQALLRPEHGTVARLTRAWRRFGAGHAQIERGWSELLFHPAIGMQPKRYPMGLERLITRYAPVLARGLARQVRVRLSRAG